MTKPKAFNTRAQDELKCPWGDHKWQLQWGLGTETPVMRGAGGQNLSFV